MSLSAVFNLTTSQIDLSGQNFLTSFMTFVKVNFNFCLTFYMDAKFYIFDILAVWFSLEQCSGSGPMKKDISNENRYSIQDQIFLYIVFGNEIMIESN